MYALILAGGKGERLRPYTEDRPKPMVEVNGIPLIGHQLNWLREQGVTDVIILCGYMNEMIIDSLKNGAEYGVNIQYSVEKEPLGRGGAFRKGFELVPETEEFVIGTNGDNLNTQSLGPMIAAHKDKNAYITVMLTPLVSPYGIASVDEESWILEFTEKPKLPHWLNAGVYVISKESFSLFPTLGDHEDSTFPQLAIEKRLLAFKSISFWKAVDTVKDLTEASREFKEDF